MSHQPATSDQEQVRETREPDLRVSELFNFSGYVCLITGGATGLGEMAAQAFVENGASVVIASRKETELEKTSTRLNALGPGKCDFIVADIMTKQGCQNLVSEVKKRTGRLTVLINNAGTGLAGRYDDFPEDAWDDTMALNVKSIFYMTAGLEPLLRIGATSDLPSRVINISSTSGIEAVNVALYADLELCPPDYGIYPYGPSKAACIQLTRLQAARLAPFNINVNAICPGLFPSNLTKDSIEEKSDFFRSIQPTGRIGQPSDFAGVVLFLSSRGGAHVVGDVLEVDGGNARYYIPFAS